MIEQFVRLSNGIKLPKIGFGTALARGDICTQSVREAIRQGYRLIDTAAQYRNEEPVGVAVRTCGLPREQILVSSKLWNEDHGYENTLRAFESTLQWMKLDYLDLYLIHWPNPKPLREVGYEVHNAESWRAMEELYKAGKIRAIGVSNFLPHHLDALLRHAEIKPMVNQIRLHPGHLLEDTVAYCRKYGIALEAYSPLGAGQLMREPLLLELAERYGRSPAQICLRWHIQNGFIPLPKSVNAERIRSNFDVFDFELAENDLNRLNDIHLELSLLPEPDDADF